MKNIIVYSTGLDGVVLMLEDGKITTISKELIADTFEKYGGSFEKSIGVALYRADAINTKKILDTWDEMVKDFISKFLL